MSESAQRFKVVLAMLTLYVVWGTTYLGIKVGLDAHLPPTLFAGVRQIPAAAIMFGIALFRGLDVRISPRDLRISAIVGILLIVGGQYFSFLAEQSIPSGIAALIVALVPLWVALAESAFPDMRRPGPLGWLGLAVGFSGLGVLLLPRLAAVGTVGGTKQLVGMLVMMVGGWLWSAGTIYSKRNPVTCDNTVLTAYEMLIAGGVLLVIGTLAREWPAFFSALVVHAPSGADVLNWKAVGALAYLVVMGSAVAFTAFTYALAHLPASKVMTYAYVNPVIAVFAGAAAGRVGLVPPEPVTFATLLGMVVIVAGVALATGAPTRPPRHEPVTREQVTLAEEPLIEPEPSEV